MRGGKEGRRVGVCGRERERERGRKDDEKGGNERKKGGRDEGEEGI